MRLLAPRELMNIRGLGAGVVMETVGLKLSVRVIGRGGHCFKTLGLGNLD